MLMLVQRRKKMVEDVIRSIRTIANSKHTKEEVTEVQLKQLQKKVLESGHPDRTYISSLIDGLVYYNLSAEEVIGLLEKLIQSLM